MRRHVSCPIVLVLAAIASGTGGAEPIQAPIPNAPATHNGETVDDRAIAMHQYFYIDFPRQLKSLQNEKQLAEAELNLIARRVEPGGEGRLDRGLGEVEAALTRRRCGCPQRNGEISGVAEREAVLHSIDLEATDAGAQLCGEFAEILGDGERTLSAGLGITGDGRDALHHRRHRMRVASLRA